MKKARKLLPLIFTLALVGCGETSTPATPSANPSAPASEEPVKPSTNPTPVTAKPKPIVLSQTRIDKYAEAVSVTSTMDRNVTMSMSGQSASYSTFGKVDAAASGDNRLFTVYDQDEYEGTAPSTPSDDVDQALQVGKSDDGYATVSALDISNTLLTQKTTSKYDSLGLGNPFAGQNLKATYFQRNTEKSTDTKKVYDRKRKEVSTADESGLLTKRTTFFTARSLSGATRSAFSFTVDATSILSYEATLNYTTSQSTTYGTRTIKASATIKGVINSADKTTVESAFAKEKTGTEDASFAAARAKIKAGNYTETSTIAMGGYDQLEVEIERAAEGWKATTSEFTSAGTKDLYGSWLFKKTTNGYIEAAQFGSKGYYARGEEEQRDRPQANISSLVFAKNNNAYVLDTGVVWDISDYSASTMFVNTDSREFTDLTVTVAADAITFVAEGTRTYNSQTVDISYTTVFTALGTTADPIGDVTINRSGDDLVRSDLLSEDEYYDTLCQVLGGADVLDRIPTYGGVFNSAAIAALNNTPIVYWDVGFNSGNFADEDAVNAYVSKIYTTYKTRLDNAGFTTVFDANGFPIGTKTITKDGTDYVLTVQTKLVSTSSGAYYFAIAPSVAATSSSTGDASSSILPSNLISANLF